MNKINLACFYSIMNIKLGKIQEKSERSYLSIVQILMIPSPFLLPFLLIDGNLSIKFLFDKREEGQVLFEQRGCVWDGIDACDRERTSRVHSNPTRKSLESGPIRKILGQGVFLGCGSGHEARMRVVTHSADCVPARMGTSLP